MQAELLCPKSDRVNLAYSNKGWSVKLKKKKEDVSNPALLQQVHTVMTIYLIPGILSDYSAT